MFEDREKVSFLLNSSFTNHKLQGRLCMDKLIQSGELHDMMAEELFNKKSLGALIF